MKVVNPFEIILSGRTTCLVNRGKVFDMANPVEPIEVDKADENAWVLSGDPLEFSKSLNKIFIKIKKEQPPTTHSQPDLLSITEATTPSPDGEGTVTRTTKTYFRIGKILSAEAKIASAFPESDEGVIIIKVAEIDAEKIKVTQYCMSDIFVINPLLWQIVDLEESDDSDSDSEPSDDQSDSDSDSDESDIPQDSDSDGGGGGSDESDS